MHDRIELMGTEQPVQQPGIAQVAVDQLTAGYQFPISGRQVVQDDHIAADVEQLSNHVRTDIPGSTDDQNGFVWIWHGFEFIGFIGFIEFIGFVVVVK
jgi:hypothetical protein